MIREAKLAKKQNKAAQRQEQHARQKAALLGQEAPAPAESAEIAMQARAGPAML